MRSVHATIDSGKVPASSFAAFREFDPIPSLGVPVKVAVAVSNTPTKSVKLFFWAALAAMSASVLFYSDLPMLRVSHPNHAHLLAIQWLLLPHILGLGGATALLLGPLQCSTRLRARNLPLHRLLGKIYCIAILIGGCFGLLVIYSHPLPPQLALDIFASTVQLVLWPLLTIAAWISVRNRQILAQWMARSYAMTFTFVLSRVLNPLKAYRDISDDAFACVLLFLTVLTLFVPDLILGWRELTVRRTQGSSELAFPSRSGATAFR